MKFINLKEQCEKLNDPQTQMLLQYIEMYRGKTFSIPQKIKVNRLHDVNIRRSVTSSNKIEGIDIDKNREEPILFNNVLAETEEEFLLDGYNKALELINQTYKFQTLSEKFIKDLHFKLYEGFNPSFGGKYKVDQNYIREYDSHGIFKRTVFVPAEPKDVDSYMGNLVYQFNNLVNNPSINTLVLIFVFILDFLCIHPFKDGNGRLSRLLSTFLLEKYGYEIDKYYATSYTILNSLSDYYKVLEQSSLGWHDDQNNYSYFVHYMLSIVGKSYNKLDYILCINSEKGSSKEKVLKIINDSLTPITKADIEEILINFSRTSIELSLSQLLKEDKILILNKGKYSKYFKK